jgi:hypothetical protein
MTSPEEVNEDRIEPSAFVLRLAEASRRFTLWYDAKSWPVRAALCVGSSTALCFEVAFLVTVVAA